MLQACPHSATSAPRRAKLRPPVDEKHVSEEQVDPITIHLSGTRITIGEAGPGDEHDRNSFWPWGWVVIGGAVLIVVAASLMMNYRNDDSSSAAIESRCEVAPAEVVAEINRVLDGDEWTLINARAVQSRDLADAFFLSGYIPTSGTSKSAIATFVVGGVIAESDRAEFLAVNDIARELSVLPVASDAEVTMTADGARQSQDCLPPLPTNRLGRCLPGRALPFQEWC